MVRLQGLDGGLWGSGYHGERRVDGRSADQPSGSPLDGLGVAAEDLASCRRARLACTWAWPSAREGHQRHRVWPAVMGGMVGRVVCP